MFPKNYDEARAHFLTQARDLASRFPDAEIRSFQVPSSKDQNLYLDELFVPSTKPRSLLMLTSGVHGLEASLGSAVQSQFMTEFLERANKKEIAIWIVHCLNPYGFKYGRRATEDNVNLNRNFGTTPETFRTPNPGYLKLASYLEMKKKAHAHVFHPFQTVVFLISRLFFGFTSRTLTQSIAQGQFTNPEGLEYGGTGPTPQARYFRERFEEIQKPFDEIVLVDLHTGLGKKNRLHLLTGFDIAKCIHKETFDRLFKPEAESDLYEFNSGDEDGFYRTIGDINMMVAECAPKKKVVALTFEFGTLGTGLIANARALSRLWLENRGTHHGFLNEKEERKIREQFKQVFEPQDPAWLGNALSLTRKVLGSVVDRI